MLGRIRTSIHLEPGVPPYRNCVAADFVDEGKLEKAVPALRLVDILRSCWNFPSSLCRQDREFVRHVRIDL
jgi:hypothetical protein